MTPLTMVILAAGAARRYGSLKQLVPVGPGGDSLLEFAAHDAVRAGFARVVLVIREEHECTFRQRFDAGLGRAVHLEYAHQRLPTGGGRQGPVPGQERTKPWGTAHAVLSAREQVPGAFAVVNADDFYGRSAYEAMARRLGDLERDRRMNSPTTRQSPDGGLGFRGAVMGYPVERTLSPEGPVSRALLRTSADGRLLEVEELPAVERDAEGIRGRQSSGEGIWLEADTPVSMNMWGFEASVLACLERGFGRFLERCEDPDSEYLLPAFVNAEIGAGRAQIDVLPTSGPWTGMTFEADREKTEQFLADLTARAEYPSPLWSS